MANLSAVDTMKKSMRELQQTQAKCVDEYGVVKTYFRERYIILTREVRKLKEAIDTFERVTTA